MGRAWRRGQGVGMGRNLGELRVTMIYLSVWACFNILTASVAMLLLNVSSGMKYENYWRAC